ncbi:MAG: pilus assembly protein PilM [Deltaproteobacteria bacterium]|nr:pilus assembly protein PilM [Deltaproteobacteria bacterium]
MAQLVAGVDLGAHSVKLVLGSVTMRAVKVVERLEVRLELDAEGNPVEGALGRALEELSRGLSSRPQLVFSALPADAVLLRTVEIPKVASRRADAILRREIEDDLPINLDDAVLDHIDRPVPGRPMLRSLVAVARTEDVREVLDLLDGAKLDPAELGAGASVYSELARISPLLASADPVMIVDMGSRLTDMVIVENGETASMRTVSVGGDDITSVLAQHYRCSFEKAEEYKLLSAWQDMEAVLEPAVQRFVPQIKQTMLAFAARTGRKVTRVLLAGGAGLLPGLPEVLSSALQTPVALLCEELDAEAGETTQTMPFLRATALAWRAISAPAEQRLDLRKGPFVFRGQARATRRRWVRAAVAGLVIVLGWSFYSLARVSSLEAKQARQRQRLGELTELYLGDEITDFNRAEKMMLSARPIRSPMPKADAFDIISEMSRIIPEEIIHDIDLLEIKPGKVQIRGIVDTISARDEIIARLEEYTECVTAISKGKTTKRPKDSRQKYTLDLETECP